MSSHALVCRTCQNPDKSGLPSGARGIWAAAVVAEKHSAAVTATTVRLIPIERTSEVRETPCILTVSARRLNEFPSAICRKVSHLPAIGQAQNTAPQTLQKACCEALRATKCDKKPIERGRGFGA